VVNVSIFEVKQRSYHEGVSGLFKICNPVANSQMLVDDTCLDKTSKGHEFMYGNEQSEDPFLWEIENSSGSDDLFATSDNDTNEIDDLFAPLDDSENESDDSSYDHNDGMGEKEIQEFKLLWCKLQHNISDNGYDAIQSY
jgi:hypothetical protein